MSSSEGEMERKATARSTSIAKSGSTSNVVQKKESYPVRNARYRREPNVWGTAPSSGGQGAPAVQKARAVPDKRPLPRTASGPGIRDRNQVASGDAWAELGSVSRPGSKKGGALNEYLNFSYDAFTSQNRNRAVAPPRHARTRNHSFTSAFNKERYLQANCQFVVLDGADYSPHLADPDLPIDWDLVEELRLVGSEVPSCPICLYPPVAAKITKCGHVYCWPCILHYLSLSDKSWRKCPICFESVYGKQLKSVVARQVERHRVGAQIQLTLMRRERGTTVALPTKHWNQNHSHIGHVGDEYDRFSKLLLLTPEEAQSLIIEREREQLEKKWSEEKDTPEAVFTIQALQALENRKQELLGRQQCAAPPSFEVGRSSSPESVSSATDKPAQDANVTFFVDAFNNVVGDVPEEERGSSASPVEIAVAENLIADTLAQLELQETVTDDLTKSYYFYQADDGQPIFLHPLNARCLVYEYGSLAEAPTAIGGRILELECLVMGEQLRQRFRYLSHLPVSTNFMLVELKLDRKLLSQETVNHFVEDFARRQKVRQKRARDDKRRERQAQKWERVLMLDPANYVPASSQLNAAPPEIPQLRYVASAQADIESGRAEIVDSQTSPQLQQPSPQEDNLGSSPPSFAQMLRLGKPKCDVAQPKEQKPSENALGMVQDDDGEGSRAPSYQYAFGEALHLALEEATTEQQPQTKGKKGKNKQKKAKKILFSTSMAAPGFH